MDEYRSTARNHRVQEIKAHAIAFVMLGLSLVALYTHVLYRAIIPLLWMAFRAGKEQGRDQAHKDIEQANALAQLIHFPSATKHRLRNTARHPLGLRNFYITSRAVSLNRDVVPRIVG